MFLEYGSQLYRNIIPAPLWVRYLSDRKDTGIVVAIIITATYLMIKGVIIFLSLRDLYRAVLSIRDKVSYTCTYVYTYVQYIHVYIQLYI